MSAYAEYQKINLPWLKAIPAHWEVRRNKNIFTEQKEIVGEKSSDYTLLSLTLSGIVPRDMDGGGKFPESFDKYKIVRNGDMAFCLFDIDETPRTVGLSGHDGMLTGAYTIMHVSNINSRFIYYYYLALDNGKMLKPLYSGLRKTININTFQSTKVPVPPRGEQDQIVRFLDWKVSSINKLISNYRHQIALLDEMKQRQIDEAAIKGMRKSVITHSDDMRWNIDYPEHWEIQRTRKSFSFRKGLSITKANLEETGIAVISYGQVHSKKNSGVALNGDLIRYVNEAYLTTNQSYSNLIICLQNFGTYKASVFYICSYSRGSRPHKWIKDQAVRCSKSFNKALRDGNRKLARVICFFNMHCLNVGNIPNIRGVFPQWISAEIPFIGAFVGFFPRVFLRNPYIIEIEYTLFALSKPKDHFMSSTKSFCTI